VCGEDQGAGVLFHWVGSSWEETRGSRDAGGFRGVWGGPQGDVWVVTSRGWILRGVAPPVTKVTLNRSVYRPGDRFLLRVKNRNDNCLLGADMYVIFEWNGRYWFWPQWQEGLGHGSLQLQPGQTAETILDFLWPAGTGSIEGAAFWSALTAPGKLEVQDIFS